MVIYYKDKATYKGTRFEGERTQAVRDSEAAQVRKGLMMPRSGVEGNGRRGRVLEPNLELREPLACRMSQKLAKRLGAVLEGGREDG
jgi:hypothetical protein